MYFKNRLDYYTMAEKGLFTRKLQITRHFNRDYPIFFKLPSQTIV